MNNEPLTQLEAATMLTQEITDLGPHAHEKEIFDAVYHFLEYLDESTYATELDEEEEYELTPASQSFLDASEAAQAEEAYVDEIESEFSPFSPSVGTFGGTRDSFLHDLEAQIDRDVVADPTNNRPVMRASALHDIVPAAELRQRAPVAERVHVPYKGGSGIQQTITDVFTPCGGELADTDHDY